MRLAVQSSCCLRLFPEGAILFCDRDFGVFRKNIQKIDCEAVCNRINNKI